MAKIVAEDGTEFASVKLAKAYEAGLGDINTALEKLPEDDRDAVKRAIVAGVVKVYKIVTRKPRTKKA